MKGCPLHRSRRPDTENFCGACGTELVPVAVPKCPKCDAETVNLCCVFCGTPRDEATKAIAAKHVELLQARRQKIADARQVKLGNVTARKAE